MKEGTSMSGRTLRVLLAEDDPIGARFAVAALERLGHDVVTVESGRAALDLLKREHFDAALLDMGLPELSGLDVSRRLRSHEKATGKGSVVIVALTASDLDERAREAAGIDAVLEKPVEVAVLGAALERCFRARAPGSVAANDPRRVAS
jgi:CheY-like chemotaxis protein